MYVRRYSVKGVDSDEKSLNSHGRALKVLFTNCAYVRTYFTTKTSESKSKKLLFLPGLDKVAALGSLLKLRFNLVVLIRIYYTIWYKQKSK